MTFADFFASLKEHADSGRMEQAWGALRAALLLPYKLPDLQKLNRTLTSEAEKWRAFAGGRTTRWAILGGITTQPIRELILPLSLSEGSWSEIYEGSYNSFETEPLDPNSAVYQFRPDIVLLATSSQNLAEWPHPGDSDERVDALVEKVLQGLQLRWGALAKGTGARLLQHNFDLPPVRPLGRLEGRYGWSPSSFVQKLNDDLWKHEGREVRLLDVSQLSADFGRWHWLEPRWYHHSKHGFDPGLICHYGRALSGLIRATRGKTRKCLVCDLDGTLWGGVIGDDGVDGIEVGNTSAAGESYAAFGRYLKGLRQLGVALAVNSKNDVDSALEVFARHPEIPLKLEDFAAFVCNWEPKSENLRRISKQLNLGLDSIVYIDDNPAECEEVRQALPAITVIEMSSDPAYFPRRLEELHLFTPLDFTAEDFTRAESYEAMRQLNDASASVTNLETYLASLEMEATIHPAEHGELPRLEQLFRKTNQFNLTSRTYDQGELMRKMSSPSEFCLSCCLKDRLANHGLVSGIVGRVSGEALIIDNWVMSCRVFTRSLEECIFAELLELAREQHCRLIRGEFVATAKNGYARALYERLGLHPASGRQGSSQFEMDVEKALTPKTFIRTVSIPSSIATESIRA